ncbi:conserved hypothetical protein [Anaeromyxobacter sp. K]|uniref:DUF2231 domain-containing protein n=1 Tax=Anaeromyxobacter sp. (strain K) TaxID=447217 RepID=UPI00015F9D2E|nr:DUF2231 domain-containing protein [Anaeromyxobacter sp. K]ACG71503.1 conserved hypothetical protein [Anaeromyxobacter sp. K]
MPMRTHELHPAIVHAPLALLPAAAIADLVATARPRDRALDAVGRTLWWSAAAGGLAAGLAGMAASQEIEVRGEHARDAMFLHGIGNLGLVVAAFGVAAWRSRNRACLTTALSGLAASAAATYTAYLGGELVYGHGAGIRALGGAASEAPALFSAAAPGRLARDAVRGLRWLLSRGARAVTGRERVDRTALGPLAEAGTGAVPPAPGARTDGSGMGAPLS